MKELNERILDEIEIPIEYTCPITHELMENPVSAADGHTYERQAIEQWFVRGRTTSPLTGVVLSHTNLTPNYAMASVINNFRERLPQMQQQRIREHRERQLREDFELAVKLREEELRRYQEQKHKSSSEEEKTEERRVKLEDKNIKDSEIEKTSSSYVPKFSADSLRSSSSQNIQHASFFAPIKKREILLPSLLKDALLNGSFKCQLERKKIEIFYISKIDFVTKKMLAGEANELFKKLHQALKDPEVADFIKGIDTSPETNTFNISCQFSSDADDLFAYINNKNLIKNMNDNPHLKGQLCFVQQGKNIKVSYEKKPNYISEEEHIKKTSAILLELESFLAKSDSNDLVLSHHLNDENVLLYTTQYTADAQELAQFLDESLGARCEDLTVKPK